MALRFFFYGTLTDEHDNAVTRRLMPLLEGGKRAWVQGRLYAVHTPDGWYPVLRRGQGRVIGRLYQARKGFSAKHLRSLDTYEGFNPRSRARSEYRRQSIWVSVVCGGRARAQVYIYNRPRHPGLAVIASGDFVKFLRQRRVKAFRSEPKS